MVDRIVIGTHKVFESFRDTFNPKPDSEKPATPDATQRPVDRVTLGGQLMRPTTIDLKTLFSRSKRFNASAADAVAPRPPAGPAAKVAIVIGSATYAVRRLVKNASTSGHAQPTPVDPYPPTPVDPTPVDPIPIDPPVVDPTPVDPDDTPTDPNVPDDGGDTPDDPINDPIDDPGTPTDPIAPTGDGTTDPIVPTDPTDPTPDDDIPSDEGMPDEPTTASDDPTPGGDVPTVDPNADSTGGEPVGPNAPTDPTPDDGTSGGDGTSDGTVIPDGPTIPTDDGNPTDPNNPSDPASLPEQPPADPDADA